MGKSKTIEELTKVLLGDINFKDDGINVYIKIYGVLCVRKYKDEFKNLDALKVPSLRRKLKKKKVHNELLNESVENYKSILKKFNRAGYKIERHNSFGPHRLRTIL
jgi:hypothetical protein